MNCPKCNAEVDGNARFCVKCGSNLAAEMAKAPKPDSNGQERTMMLYENYNDNVRRTMHISAMDIQRANAPQQPQIPIAPMPPMQGMAEQQQTEKSGGGLVIAAAVLGVLTILAGAACFLVLNGTLSLPAFSIWDKSDEDAAQNETQDAEQANEIKQDIEQMISEGKYEDAIKKIAEAGLDETDGAEILQRAVDGLYQQSVSETNDMSGNLEFEAAQSILAQRKQLILDAAEKTGYLQEKHEYDMDMQNYYVSRAYCEYWYKEADKFAYADNEGAMLDALAKVDVYDGDADMKKRTELCYSILAAAHVDVMRNRGSSYDEILRYISSSLGKTGNNCRITELWFYYNNQYYTQLGRVAIEETKVRDGGWGYIFPDSNSRELTIDELLQLTGYERYIALFEMYARHGRLFSDPSLIIHFSKFDWYEGNVSMENFDESVLNDIEKKNIGALLSANGIY